MMDRVLRPVLQFLVRSFLDPSWTRARHRGLLLSNGFLFLLTGYWLASEWTAPCQENLQLVLFLYSVIWLGNVLYVCDRMFGFRWLEVEVDEFGNPVNRLKASVVSTLPYAALVYASLVTLMSMALLFTARSCSPSLRRYTIAITLVAFVTLTFLGAARALSCVVINYLWGPSALRAQRQARNAEDSAAV